MPRSIVVGCRVQGSHGPFLELAVIQQPDRAAALMEGRQCRPRRKHETINGTVIGHDCERWIVRWDEDKAAIASYRTNQVKFMAEIASPPITEEQRNSYLTRFRPTGTPARTTP